MVVYQLNWLFHSVQIEKKRVFFSYEISWKKCCNSKINLNNLSVYNFVIFILGRPALKNWKLLPQKIHLGNQVSHVTMVSSYFWHPPPRSGRYPPLGWTSLSTVVKFISLPRRCWSMTFEKVRIVRLLANAWILHLQ